MNIRTLAAALMVAAALGTTPALAQFPSVYNPLLENTDPGPQYDHTANAWHDDPAIHPHVFDQRTGSESISTQTCRYIGASLYCN